MNIRLSLLLFASVVFCSVVLCVPLCCYVFGMLCLFCLLFVIVSCCVALLLVAFFVFYV